MNMGFEPGLYSGIAAIAGLLGLLIWFIIRKRRQRVWLPILRVVDLENRLLPKMTITVPPWVAFLCFVICTLAFLFFATEPRQKIFKPFEPNQTHLHVYFDMSPSMALHESIDQYAQRAANLLASFDGFGRVTYSTSHGKEIIDRGEPEQLVRRLTELNFHREGLKIGDSLKGHLELLGDVNLLVIFSDGNPYSWDGFNWSYLEDDMEIRLVRGPESGGTNVFIDDVKPTSKPGDDLVEWDVSLSRSGRVIPTSGSMRVTYQDKEIYEGTWSIPEERESIELRVRWPADAIKVGQTEAERDIPLVWQIQSDADETNLLDNEFRTYPLGAKRNILVVGDHGGERFLEDPVHHLRIALQVIGFNVQRLDRFAKNQLKQATEYPVWVVLAGEDRDLDSQCPAVSLEPTREGKIVKEPLKWLAPFGVTANWRNMCRCFARFSGLERNGTEPEYCKDVQTRDQFVGVLKSVGAKPVGGELSKELSTLAWHMKDDKSRLEVLTFTVPLRPDLGVGISYASLPLMIKSLVNWQKLAVRYELQDSAWPRVKSIADLVYSTKDDDIKIGSRISNIPAGESMTTQLAARLLPAVWNPKVTDHRNPIGTKKDQEDPMPILKMLAIIMIAACAGEAMYLVLRFVVNLAWRHRRIVGFGLMVLLWRESDARAEIELNLLGFTNEPLAVKMLARDVAVRTSIELDPMASSSMNFSDAELAEPWMWVNGADRVSASGVLFPEIVRWIKRGGFLVVENIIDHSQLVALTSTNEFPVKPSEGWGEIPPDHELMRSFHLLDSLPGCRSVLWQGFRFDGRLAILAIPGGFIRQLTDQKTLTGCDLKLSNEKMMRTFVNILMVALATDYKKDQIHLPEILKRLR